MAVCINKNSIEYQLLKDRAGISEFTLEAICRDFTEKYGRFPHLDELPNSNSEQSLRDTFKIKENNGVKISDLLEITGKETVEQATIDINNQYRDLEVKILPIVEEAIVDVAHRPIDNNFENLTEEEKILAKAPRDKNGNLLAPNGYLVLNNALQKLASLYGITFNEITDAELNSEEWSNLIPDAQSVNAFVYNGQIYINMDRANLDAPIHEMFHILVGSMRFENPTLYTNLISSVENLYNYSALAEQYPNRSRNDVNEEIFITELSKYFSGLPSQLMNLDQKSMHELTYNIIRTLDSILMGEDSVRTVSEDRLYNMSFKTLINEVNSTIATSKFTGFINMEGSELHRKLNNIKSDLLKNKQLEEICD